MANDNQWQTEAGTGSDKKSNKKKNSQGSNGKGSSGSSGSSSSGPLGGLQSTIKSLMGFGGGSAAGSTGTGKTHKKKSSTGSTSTNVASPSSFKKGGKVKKTGKALVHKGEVVLTSSQVKGLAHKRTGKNKSVARKRVSGKA
jgi:hypothetical protein